MKILYPIISLAFIVTISISAFTLSNLQGLNINDVTDEIRIDEVSVVDPGYQCFAAPCFFRSLSFNLTIVNTFQKTLDSSCLNHFTIKILPGLHHDDQWFKVTEDFIQISCIESPIIIPFGTWQDNYSTTLYLFKMPSNDYQIPSSINIQIVLGNNVMVSSIYQLDLFS